MEAHSNRKPIAIVSSADQMFYSICRGREVDDEEAGRLAESVRDKRHQRGTCGLRV